MTPRLTSVLPLIACLIVPAAPACAAASGTEDACARTVFDYAFFRDALDAPRYATVFTDDAAITFGGKTYKGKTEIVAELEGLKSAARRMATRHVMTNVRVTPDTATTATGTAYLTFFTSPATDDGGAPLAVQGPTAVGVYTIGFKTGGGLCKIATSKLDITFVVRRPAPTGATPPP